MSGQGWWVNHPWRLIQTNLREIDMADIDAERYVEELQSFGATIGMINVGGIIASYPTSLPFHFQSPYLTGDSLADIIRECHAHGIKVVARNDFSKVRRPLYGEHPEWAYRTRDGRIVDYNGDVHVCLNGDYQQRYAGEIVREVITTLDVDGMFFNMGGFQVRDYSYRSYGICHCAACRTRFRDDTGYELPTSDDPLDPAVRAYEVAKARWSEEWEVATHDLIQSIRPDVAMNHFEFQRQETNTEIGRALPRWQYDASSNTRWVKTSKPGTISSNTTVDFIGFYYRHVAVNPAQQELRLWQNLANGGGLDYYLIGRLDNHRDRSGFDRVRTVFRFHEQHEALYANLEPEATTLLVRDAGLSGEAKGWIRFLTEAHFPFAEVRLEYLGNVDLSRYRCIVLPDVRYLSDAAAARIDDFVESGGTLVATGESGFYSDDRSYRGATCLASLGIERVRMTGTDLRSALLEIDAQTVLPDMDDVDLLYFGDTYVYADYSSHAEHHLRLIPPHMYGPPERCYFTHSTEAPGFTVTPFGRGRSVYLPWRPGELFHREGYDNTSRFITALLTSYTDAQRIVTTASPMIEITVNRSGDSRVVTLVNTSGHFASSVCDPLPALGVTVTIPAARAPRTVTALRANEPLDFRHESGAVTFTVDVPGICEVVVLKE